MDFEIHLRSLRGHKGVKGQIYKDAPIELKLQYNDPYDILSMPRWQDTITWKKKPMSASQKTVSRLDITDIQVLLEMNSKGTQLLLANLFGH